MTNKETVIGAKEIGGNVKVTGFGILDSPSMLVAKKIIETYAKKYNDFSSDVREVHITLKPLHEREKSEKYQVDTRVQSKGKIFAAEHVDRNVFVALDKAMGKVQQSMSKLKA